MAYQMVTATVAAFERWKAAFEENHTAREEHGSEGYHLFRGSDDPDEITVLMEFDTAENARRWESYLREQDDMDAAGMSDVDITYLDLVERQTVGQQTA
ncbi:antibiotic biosynthesis monooxygenase [Salinirubellus salinus]|jgi:heme-degrading monooxygenase HmoA|uniref:Antibiotic biosynthesis monooxygenase n=1 Tax=Salinirubellus salinus TaxID=1364945 RepID=A0A9E7R1U4_9EURY|nr:antibiotic biosynthesis monooxygenase [Salinirubellus salinus]UWM53962.1 antibiotic biosynthesis monooxygenase [Salinirubellus salinus]